MKVFLLSLLVIVLAMLGMALGTLAGRRPIKGSCGGAGRATAGGACDLCAEPREAARPEPLVDSS
jgi:hypothetical protein